MYICFKHKIWPKNKHFFKQGVIYPKKLCLNLKIIFTTNYVHCYVLFYYLFWQFNHIMCYILDILSMNMTWNTNGLWVWAMWPKQLPFKEYNEYVYILPKWNTFIVWPWTNDKWWQFGIFPTMQCLHIVLSGHTYRYVIHARTPYGGDKIKKLLLFCPKLIISINCLLLHKWGSSCMFPPFEKH